MNVIWPDLPGALLWLAGSLVFLAGLVGLAAWDARRRRSPAVVVDVAGAVARVWVAFTGVGIVLTCVRWLTDGDVWIEDFPVVVTVPGLTCGASEEPVTATTPTLVCGSIDSADVTVTGLDAGIRLLLASADLLTLLVVAVPGVVLAVACGQALKGAPFSRTVGRWLLIGAVVVLIAGLGGEFLGSLGRAILSNEIFPPAGDLSSTGVYHVAVSFWPIGAAFALAALGAIFRYGERLERETAGLV